jgi:subtilase family serine protease
VTPTSADWGEMVTAEVRVANRGDEPAEDFRVRWRWGSGDFDACEWTAARVNPGAGLAFTCAVQMYVSYETLAEADVYDEVEEVDEDNNSSVVEVTVASP